MTVRYWVAVAAGLCLAMTSTAGQAGTSLPPRCALSQLTLAFGDRVSEATGQDTLIIRLTNLTRTCTLDGYPRLVFSDRSGPVPFRVSDRGDQMITNRRPTSVVIAAHRQAIVMLNKYRCDLGNRRVATRLSLRVPPLRLRSGALDLSLVGASRSMAWCGWGDPGSTIDVTPFEPTVQAARR